MSVEDALVELGKKRFDMEEVTIFTAGYSEGGSFSLYFWHCSYFGCGG